MYKDKDQQKEANRLASQRRRSKAKGMTQGMTITGYDGKDVTGNVIPKRTRTEGCKVAIPGDEDYVGVCQKVDGVWRVVAATDRTPVRDLTRRQLTDKIQAYPHDQWVNSPEHTELMRRLRTMSVDDLEQQGYWIPAWKRAG